MANTYPSLALIAEKAVPALRKKIPLLTAFVSDYSAAATVKGSSTTVYYLAEQTASIYAGTRAPSDKTMASVTLTYGEPIQFPWGITPAEQSGCDEDMIVNKIIVPSVQAVCDAAYGRIFTLYTAGNFPLNSYSGSTAGFGYHALSTGSKYIDKSGSMNQKVAILSADADYALDTSTVNRTTTVFVGSSVNEQPAADGPRRVGRCLVYQAGNLPATLTGFNGLITVPDAIAVAGRTSPPMAGAEVSYINDPMSGVTFMLERWTDITLGKVIYNTSWCFAAGIARQYLGSKVIFTD